MDTKMRIFRLFLWSSLLGLVTTYAISGISHLPYSKERDWVSDALSFPGGMVARVFYPEGVHTGHGSPSWGLLAASTNLIFYILVWLLVLWIARRTSTEERSS